MSEFIRIFACNKQPQAANCGKTDTRMKKETVRLEKLSIGYKSKGEQKTVGENINATLYGGELTCLIGANGIGKSTLLRTLCSFQPQLAGDIIVEGKSIGQYTDLQLARMIGVVLTTKPHVQNMTVREMVGMGRSPYTGFWGRMSERDKHIVDEAITMTGIGKLENRMIQTLSDGERQKVMIAKALAQQTSIIYLDEPTAFLDYPSKVEMMQLLHRLSRETQKTIFLSNHDLDLALQIADTIWLMAADGLHIGTPRELATDGSLTAFIEQKGICFDRDELRIRIATGASASLSHR
jgi:iron complex transport system ATP-binding protein